MPKKPIPADADLILKLYDLRREAEIRKARNWWLVDFWPDTAADVLKVAQALGTQENNWLRQVAGYWELAASLVVHGTVNETLFLEPAFSGEMFLIFAKVQPFLKELREKVGDPHFFLNIEKVITHTKWGRDRLQFMVKRVEIMRQKRAERKAS